MRVRFTDRFLAEASEEDPDGEGDAAAGRLDSRRIQAYICSRCGALTDHQNGQCPSPPCRRPGPLAPVWVIIEGDHGFSCPACGAVTHRLYGRPTEPLRPLRGVTVSDVHILAQEMISAAPSDAERRLLIFADNRQDAAFQAGWMRDHARRYRLRYLIIEAVRSAGRPVSVGDVHDALYRRLSTDRDLARILAPEAFSSEADEAFGASQRADLRRFLRVQVLREITPSMQQIESLERWGQIRVIYAGIEATAPGIVHLAADHELEPDDLAQGISTLLDMWRRGSLLNDPDEPVFGRWWRLGDEEVQRGFVPQGLTDRPPKGLKLRRSGGPEDQYVQALLSARGRTSALDFVSKWGVSDAKGLVEAIWDLARRHGLLVPVVLTGGRGNAVPGTSGAHQVAVSQIGLIAQHVRWRCGVCQRIHARPTPRGACTKRFCPGQLVEEAPPTHDYNVSLLDRPFSMVMPEEHTAQVPHAVREEIEREFKERAARVNTLVATPTLELGVDIGALDLVLLRNVPPTAANYWQRVGRAGRRRRMAVIFTYCRRMLHDGYFFEDPERLLGAPVRPPRFNMKNDVLVAKHVQATILSELLRLDRDNKLNEAERATVAEAFPTYIADYLFRGERQWYRDRPLDVSPLRGVIDAHREHLRLAVEAVFSQGWPDEAIDEVTPARLADLIDTLASDLQEVVDRLHQRMVWARDTQQRLSAEANARQLDKDEAQQLRRSRDYLSGLSERRRDTYVLSVLATEGFLPGYGIYEGGVAAFPGRTGQRDFQLTRPRTIALREFVPGNLLYANRRRFRAARYQFPVGRDVSTDTLRVDVGTGRVRDESSAAAGYGSATEVSLATVPICDTDLAPLGLIRDEELERFQLPVVVLGMTRGDHRGGSAYRAADRQVLHVLGEGLRLTNVGPADKVRQGELGYPVCRVCGAARSPYASARELHDFEGQHHDRCGRNPDRLGFTSEATVDALKFDGLASQEEAASLGEALRIGGSQVLEMETDDLQVLLVPDDVGFTLHVYDPMPGGSGLLAQLVERWEEIRHVLNQLLTDCPGGCERSCYQCLRTGRNVFWHRVLDRAQAQRVLEGYPGPFTLEYEMPPVAKPEYWPGGEPTNTAEARLAALLERAGLGGYAQQHGVDLGPPYDRTVPDFAYPERHVAVYLNGLSSGIHGDRNRAQVDAIIRAQLEDRDWTVVDIADSHLDDPEIIVLQFKKIARALAGREKAAQLDADRSWLEVPASDPPGESLG
jgi:hypothetical protein